MKILAGLSLGGAALTAVDDLRPGGGALGVARVGPGELLCDLELRLGVGLASMPEPVRVAAWAERMARIAPSERFYSRSFAVDPLGTARALLELRDELVEAGWKGEQILDGGSRLDAVAELESLPGPSLPGDADRLAALEQAVESAGIRLYDEIRLAEPEELWPSRWQHIFVSLASSGTAVRVAADDLPGAAPDSDLGRVQSALRDRCASRERSLDGDGSFVLLEAETSWEAARATAALVGTFPAEQVVVVRDHEASVLDHAFEVQGLRWQGRVSRTPWRAATQVLPLALELAFEPKDPYRVLELVTLPAGPFRGAAGHRLARALVQSPGVGSPAWVRAKSELGESAVAEDLPTRIDEWLERPGADPVAGAPKDDLLEVIERVRGWVTSRIMASPDDPTLLLAAGQAAAMRAILEKDPRVLLGVVEVRRLVESVLASGTRRELSEEQAGRSDHVAHPGALRAPREVVVWWSFVNDGSSLSRRRWRAHERKALLDAGIVLPDPRVVLAERGRDFRRAILAATKRVVLVVPQTSAGKRWTPHVLWDEIAALVQIDDATRERLTLNVKALRDGSRSGRLLPFLPFRVVAPLPLPGGNAVWQLQDGERISLGRLSASSLGALLGCPLQWALGYGAGLREGGHTLPRLHQLNGELGHRLVECLHLQGAFGSAEDAELEGRATTILEKLIESEGAVLLRPGMAFERAQLQSQLVRAVRELSRMLRASGLRILAVEQQVEAPFRDKTLLGRLDLLVGTDAGVRAIVDMKWGFRSYRELLQAGRALQLAFYGFAHSAGSNLELIEAAYFSLSRGRLLAVSPALWSECDTVDGPGIAGTWRLVERSLATAEEAIGAGSLPVSGLRKSLPLLEAFGVSPGERAAHYSLEAGKACEYCRFDALCGRRWEMAS